MNVLQVQINSTSQRWDLITSELNIIKLFWSRCVCLKHGEVRRSDAVCVSVVFFCCFSVFLHEYGIKSEKTTVLLPSCHLYKELPITYAVAISQNVRNRHTVWLKPIAPMHLVVVISWKVIIFFKKSWKNINKWENIVPVWLCPDRMFSPAE